jgi:hypothetical protein
MQKISLGFAILTSFLVIIFLMEPLAQFGAVDANPYTFAPGLHVYSPTPGLYCAPNAGIHFKIYLENDVTQIDSFSYSLDNKANSPLTFTMGDENHSVNGIIYTVSVIEVYKTLGNLANGNHTITVYAHYSNRTVNSIINTAITIDTTLAIPFTPFIISPLNQTTYNTKQVPLTYTIAREVLWSYYSLDSKYDSNLKSFNGNITLPSLSEGQHELMLAVTTKTSPTSQQPQQTIQKIYFTIDTTKTIDTPSPSPTPNSQITTIPTVLASASISNNVPLIAVLSALGLALFVLMTVFYKRRKKVSDRYD